MTTHPQRVLLANALAAEYFRDCLHSSIGDGPRGYLQGRGVSDRALRGAGLGDRVRATGLDRPGRSAAVGAVALHRPASSSTPASHSRPDEAP